MLECLASGIAARDPDLVSDLETTEPLALDQAESVPIRQLAAFISAKGEPARPFRDKFIRSTLASQDARLIGVLCHYLHNNGRVGEFLPEFVEAFESPSADARAQAALVFAQSTPTTALTKEQDRWLQVAGTMLADSELSVRIYGLNALWIQRNNGLALRELVPSLIELARHVDDSSDLAKVVAFVSNELKREPHDLMPCRDENHPAAVVFTRKWLLANRDAVADGMKSWLDESTAAQKTGRTNQ